MSRRASMFGNGAPGGAVEYRGDLTPPVTSYASSRPGMPMTSRLFVPASTNRTNSAVVVRQPRRGRMRSFYVHGAVPMPGALPYPGAAGVGEVQRSLFQRFLIQLMDWQINASWAEAGRPRNLGLSTRVPQLETNVTGGTGQSSMDQRPLFTRVQQVGRARATVNTYPTKGTRS